MATPKNKELWSKVTKKWRGSAEGSPAGKWSARKMALARRDYAKQGGKWKASGQPAPKTGTPKAKG